MKRYSPSHIRNVVLVGHSGAGKTTLAEALLHRAGVTTRMGRVDQGSTVCDYDPEEQRRGLSLSLAMAPFEWHDHKINLIDTPGYADFVGDVIAALRVCDLAIFVVSAVEGVQVQTEAVWKIANKMGVPRMVFVNKLDLERADFQATLSQLQSRFGAGIAPLELPIGEGPSFQGIADLLTDQAYLYNAGVATQGEIPAEMESLEHQVHDSLVEGIVVADEELLERYLEGDVPSVLELEATLAKGVAEASVFPVVLGSALAESAIDRLADFICEIGPSPVDRPTIVHAGATEVEVKANESGEPLAFVFKSIADQYVGQVSLFKVISGTIKPDLHLINSRTSADERLHGLFALRGKEQVQMSELVAGDLGAVAKLGNTGTSDTLAPKGKPVVVPRIDQPAPSLAVAIVPRTQPDEDKLGNVLHRIQHEDPAIVVERDEETHQTLLRGTGETHLSVTLEKIQRKFGVNVDTEDVRVRYRETVTGTSDAEGKHKKQSGGHGQFAVCNLKMAPRRPWGRLRVRRQHRRRCDPPFVHTCGRKGHRRGDGVRRRLRLSGGRPLGDVVRRQVPLGGFQRGVVQDGGPARFSRSDGQSEPRVARADFARRSHGAERQTGRCDGRPQHPPRSGAGIRGARRRRTRGARTRADQ